MKLFHYAIITITLLTACGRSDQQLICNAEAVMTDHPDSALTLLNRVENIYNLNTDWKMRYWVASAEARDRMGQSLSEDSTIVLAYDYYQHRKPIDSLMLRKVRALNACYYYWNGRMDEAKLLMKQSLEESRIYGSKEETLMHLDAMAELAFREHNMEDIIRYVEDIIRIDGTEANHADLLNGMALGYYYRGKDSLCIATFRRAIAYRETAADSVYVWGSVMRNYADILLEMGQVDRCIEIHEGLLRHYRQQPSVYKGCELGSLFSLSYSWLLKGDKQRAQHYKSMLPPHGYDEYDFSANELCKIAHCLVMDYATTGFYKLTDMAEYANGLSKQISKKEAVAMAKERMVHQLREQELQMTVSRQRDVICFLMLTVCMLTVIIILFIMARRRKRQLSEMEMEIKTLNEQLQSLRPTDPALSSSEIVLSGTTSEPLTLQLSDLLYIEAVGNYVKVYHVENGKTSSDMLRTTSKHVEEVLQDYPTIVRCHRAFLVNLMQVEKIISHTGMMQLVIRHSGDTIPVSRSNMAQIKKALSK